MKHIVKYMILGSLPLTALSAPVAPAMAQNNTQSANSSLQDALRRIARNSNDSSALADAGLAALDLGDTRAALGFLARANEIYPRSGRVKVGLARALLQEQNPFGAIRYFDEATANGIPAKDIAIDRGLAYDLIGRNADAQKDYKLALSNGQSDTLLKRYAISLGISGDVAGAESQLGPLLQKSDRDAWRNRAFILAMNGQEKEANKIAQQTMRKQMAKAIKPFFDRMPKLTAAQKAAAVHFGHFPASENIGVDVASVRFASQNAVRGGDGADAGLIPIGEPLGQEAEKPKILAMPDTSPRRRPGAKKSKKKKVVRVASRAESNSKMPLSMRRLPVPTRARPLVKPAAAKPAVEEAVKPSDGLKTTVVDVPKPGFETTVGGSAKGGEQPVKLASAQPTTAAKPLVSEKVTRKVPIGNVKPVTPPTEKPEQKPVQRPVQKPAQKPVQLVTFDLAQANGAAPASAASSNNVANNDAKRPLSAIIGSIAVPEKERELSVVPVDLAKITPAKPKPIVAKTIEKKEVKPEPPKHPKRYWVQIATGSDLKALKYDYGRMSRKNVDLFADTNGWTSPWGKTRRLVVGPFTDFSTAKKFEAGFRKGGGDGFAWVSANGTEVNKLN
ncbi:MAG: SPOR domain-containing protein [Parasphingorhabdus sp.]|uniref:tetratricopeptide repeat protein n=1 Tax=Parasphingorhabdus sp. TaxID=2709688 RepID=UPI00329783E2